MEAREKLCTISDSLKVLQNGHAGRVLRVKNWMCKLNFATINFVVRSQLRKLRKFADRELSFPRPTVFCQSLLYHTSFDMQTVLIVEILDEQISSNWIDKFEIIITSSVFCFNKSNPLTINGIWGVARITLVFYNLTTNPTLCNSETTHTSTATIINTSSLPCECVCIWHKYSLI